ncbi:type II secretion system protein [Novilysobacter spongiicola]|uniref:Type II secretory pathway, pseudopilin PulG n=1 Tax=Lysobacter spongiicola DSM 21749 TaxID=1122188 RepID=A0A1T4PFF7_9GAMM|nr:type II secretion system protein [Lysobacter spongiicola]SJZ90101.1 Type II secretory pathway, pseudopilin PulG [Lysobacter spongiicola DSM 21749]
MAKRAHQPGFTLMETLVMLVLVSFAVTLMFQMLGSYRVAKERTAAQAGRLDRSALMQAWFRESVEGLYPLDGEPLQGATASFSAQTLNPLHASPGAPVAIGWSLEQEADASWIVYSEAGEERWRLEMRDAPAPGFVFLDGNGATHAGWPPAQGLQEALPAAVGLVWDRNDSDTGRLLLGSVRHSREPRMVPFESEVD